jgi:FkbM family methyltransferase
VSRLPGAHRLHSTIKLPKGQHITFPTFDSYWARYLWAGVRYEPDVEAIMRNLGKIPDKLLIDCGANIGYWSVRAVEPEFGFSEVVAVEANPRLIPVLRQNVARIPIRGEVIAAAIAESSGGSVLLDVSPHHALVSVAESGRPVPTISLGDIVSDRSRAERTIVVKLDVEGSEIAALRGAPSADQARIIYVVEDWPRSGMTVTEFLLSAGYQVVGVSPDGKAEILGSVTDAIEFNERTRKVYGPSNVVACRSGRMALHELFGAG